MYIENISLKVTFSFIYSFTYYIFSKLSNLETIFVKINNIIITNKIFIT